MKGDCIFLEVNTKLDNINYKLLRYKLIAEFSVSLQG